jgi:hypothetical protein
LSITEYTYDCIIARDLNVTLHYGGKGGGSVVRDPFKEKLEDLINGWELVDVKPTKGKFTWSIKRIGPGYSSKNR